MAKISTNLTGLRDKLLSLKDARLFTKVLKKKYFPQTASGQDINLSSELDRINAPADLQAKVKKLLDSRQTHSSHSAQVSKSESTEPLGSYTDQATNNSEVNIDLLSANNNTEMLTADKNTEHLADIKDNEVLNDIEICSLFGEKSIQKVVDQFTPLIKAVFRNISSS